MFETFYNKKKFKKKKKYKCNRFHYKGAHCNIQNTSNLETIWMPNSKKRDKNIMVDTHDYIATKNYICKEYLMPQKKMILI